MQGLLVLYSPSVSCIERLTNKSSRLMLLRASLIPMSRRLAKRFLRNHETTVASLVTVDAIT